MTLKVLAMTRATKQTSESGETQWYQAWIPLQPVPASRPRVSRWGTYYPKRHKEYWAAALDLLERNPLDPITKPVGVNVTFRLQKARTSRLDDPHPDIDNLMKMVFDLMTEIGVWKDDKQVVRVSATKVFALPGQEAGTHITIETAR